MGDKGWGVPDLAEASTAAAASPRRGPRAAAGDERRRRLEPDRRHGHDDVRPDPAGIRHRGAEAAAHPAPSPAARSAGARASPSRARAPTSPALQTKAEDKGDHFLVNGQKIWTSGAQWADWCFCLVRTDTTRKHEGISFLLIDMHAPGVEVRPIRLIAGASPFCETFFTDVKVPKENLVGPLNGGWTIAKRLLQHERNGIGGGGAGGTAAAASSASAARRPSWPRATSASTRGAASPTADLRARVIAPRDGRPGVPADRRRARWRSPGPTRARARPPRS